MKITTDSCIRIQQKDIPHIERASKLLEGTVEIAPQILAEKKESFYIYLTLLNSVWQISLEGVVDVFYTEGFISTNVFYTSHAAYPFLSKDDGVTHINVYTKGKTDLGRLLSNLTTSDTFIDIDGESVKFKSLEGYWYYLLISLQGVPISPKDFTDLVGFTAKKYGQSKIKHLNLDKSFSQNSEFQERFKVGLRNKIKQDKKILKILTYSVLPFTHYYVYKKAGESQETITRLVRHNWILLEIERIRTLMQVKMNIL